MALTDSASFAALSRLGAGWELLSHRVSAPETGWDVMTARLVRDYGSQARTADQVAADWPLGRRVIAGSNFWTVARTPERLGGNIWGLDVTAHGSSGERPLKYRVRSTVSVASVQNGTVGPPFLPTISTGIPSVGVKSSVPSVEVSFIVIGQEVDTTLVGQPGATPPKTVPVRPPPWEWLTQWTLNIPGGWCLDDMDVDPLAGTDTPASLVTEIWNFQFLITP
jgi:hypothetical protein